MSIVSDFCKDLIQYLIDPPDILPVDYNSGLNLKINVFKRLLTPTFIKKGNILELRNLLGEYPSEKRTTMIRIMLARLERKIDFTTFCKRMSGEEDES